MAAQLVFDRRPRAVLAVNDSLLMIRRSCTHIIRNTDQLLGAFFQPIMFLVLFAAVFGGAISKALPPDVSYLNFLMPGIIVQTLAFGSTMTAQASATTFRRASSTASGRCRCRAWRCSMGMSRRTCCATPFPRS